MVEVTQEVREAAADIMRRMPFGGMVGWASVFHGDDDGHWIVQAFAAHRQAAFNAGRASAVEWLRDDANMTEIEARRILGNLVKLTPADTDDWAKLILMKHGIADALERLP